MKIPSLFAAFALALLAVPVTAWADHNPDFDDDAKPILRMQPNLLAYVEASFEVKDTGIAKIPGDDDRHAQPPYIFQAKPRGYPGSYYLTMLIQPGSPGHILKIVDPTKANGGASQHAAPASKPTSYNSTPSSSTYTQTTSATTTPSTTVSHAVTPAKAPSTASKAPTGPTSDTPSGPLTANSPSLEPPPDPAPSTH